MAVEYILFVVCLIFSAFFSATETAFISLSKIKVLHMAENHVPGAGLVKKLKDNPVKLITTVLVGNNIVNISASVLATTVILKWAETLNWGGVGVAAGISTGVTTFLILVFGEITPKTLAIKYAEQIALYSAWLVIIISWILTPIASLLTFFSRPIVLLFGGNISEKGPFVTEEEIKTILSASAEEGVIEREKKEMLSSIFEFGETTVKEVMTPRPDIKAIESSANIDDVIDIIKETGHSRIPAYEGNIDNISGMVYAKDLIDCRRGEKIKDYLRPAMFVPEAKRLDDVLHQMQATHTHLAAVVDEYGVTVGIVSMEDLVEEIVGEIHDEFEIYEKNIDSIDENTYIVDGKLSIYDVNKQLDIALPEGEYETIAGFVLNQLNKAPGAGDSVKYDGVQISVEKVLKRRITRLKIVKLPQKYEDNIVGG
ncbi:MAG: hypothetical protein FD145_263 [Candidatus Saganbacteria bacterium]|uniref:HlyC/CorC family transporter n=1 Tax=Candidatus Saganbacteria bacterium TaxID=2575572 RepID=A0A833L4X8_UNCSA|nr:MAG: hypothetical protein FD145_263 [Candidatus Saganbacteria bacterium]